MTSTLLIKIFLTAGLLFGITMLVAFLADGDMNEVGKAIAAVTVFLTVITMITTVFTFIWI
jgi:hypothetical protein